MGPAATFRLRGSRAHCLEAMVATAVAIKHLPEVEILDYEVRGPAEGVILVRVHQARRRTT